MNHTPIHPGKILADELEQLSISASELAHQINVSPNRILQILAGKRSLTADTALRLSQFFGTTADLWMNLQKEYELNLAREKHGNEIKKIPQYSKKLNIEQFQRKSKSQKVTNTPKSRKEFMKLSIIERRNILKQQAQELSQHYENEDIGGGDFIEY